MGLSITTKNEQETIEFAKKFLKKALKETGSDSPLIFYLTGELGAGKTHFVKGLAEELGIKDNITSPTFVLMKKYAIPTMTQDNDNDTTGHRSLVIGYRSFYHIDCYRIYDAEDAKQIGLDKVLENPRAIVAIEWAERISDIIPLPYWKIEFEHVGEEERFIKIKYQK